MLTLVVLLPSLLGLIALRVIAWNSGLWERVLNWFVIAFLVTLLTKNITDILWNGHSPLLS